MVVLLLAAGLFINSSPASAIPTPTSEIRYIETSLDGSHFLYDFTVYNTSVSNGFNIIDLSLDFDSRCWGGNSSWIFTERVCISIGWFDWDCSISC